ITDTLALDELAFMQNLVEQYRNEHDVPAVDIAAALAQLLIGDKPLLLKPDQARKERRFEEKSAGGKRDKPHGKRPRDKALPEPDSDKERYRIEVGHEHGVKPGNIVGAIANEAGLDGDHIGHIEIDQNFSLVDLPVGMPRDIFMDLKKVRVCGRPMKITKAGGPDKPVRRSKAKATARPKAGARPGKARKAKR
ncbi:MAG: DbpA RNA binding domain-containing protein, partial [Gammaproteobacteria bacterium]|nr:DbpA RNA binding domain-containing protein [Gammaproteobacteria bacterium]